MSGTYALLCVGMPCLVYQIFALRKRKPDAELFAHMLFAWLFIGYVYMALQVADIGSIWDIGRYDGIIREDQINLKLFDSDGYLTYVLNIIMFIPLGFLLPLIWKEYRKIYKALRVGFCFSFAIEFCQLFNFRITDVDDLVMNTLGACVGYMLWYVSNSLLNKIKLFKSAFLPHEPEMYLCLAVAGRFFLYNSRLLL